MVVLAGKSPRLSGFVLVGAVQMRWNGARWDGVEALCRVEAARQRGNLVFVGSILGRGVSAVYNSFHGR